MSTRAQASREPNGDNYRPISAIVRALIRERAFADEGELVEAAKERCARLRVDYGRHPDVRFNVVHRAVRSELVKQQRGLVGRRRPA